jgi:hypothetical protein
MAEVPATEADHRTWMERGARVFTADGADAGTVAEAREDGIVVAPREGSPFHVSTSSIRSVDPDGIWLTRESTDIASLAGRWEDPGTPVGAGRYPLHDSTGVGSVHVQELARARRREEFGVFRDADTGYLSDASRRAFDAPGRDRDGGRR